MRAEKIMAGRLLGMGLAALLVHGCLIPQDDPLLPDLPLKKNTSPQFGETITPAQRNSAPLKLDPSCLPREQPFGIPVIDPDLGDTIRSRWFVDHDNKFTTIAVDGMGLSSKTAQRGISRPLPLLYSPGSLLFNAGPHYVTVVVADRDFIPGGIELVLSQFDSPDGGKIDDTSQTAKYTWEVITDRSPCQ